MAILSLKTEMNEVVCLVIGIILLLVIVYDFFFTTLSISGAGFVSRGITLVSYKVIQFFFRMFGRRIYSFSGLTVNLSIFFTWLIVIWIGLFFLYSSNPEAITNSEGRAASTIERLYFTGYVLSTLGMGNFYPTTVKMEVLSSIFSFFGFIFFTSSITYFLSVSSAVINQRILSRSIERLGKTPEKIAAKLLEIDSAYAYQQLMSFQTMLDRHVANHQAYPVIHYFSHPQPQVCLGLNVVRLDEAVSILISSDKTNKIKEEVGLLRETLTAYLNHLEENYSGSLPKGKEKVSSQPLDYKITNMNSTDLNKRRKILRGVLRSEGFEWADISPRN